MFYYLPSSFNLNKSFDIEVKEIQLLFPECCIGYAPFQIPIVIGTAQTVWHRASKPRWFLNPLSGFLKLQAKRNVKKALNKNQP